LDVPLQSSLTICFTPKTIRRDEYLSTGILHMATAVSFINNDCKMVRRRAQRRAAPAS
jgi:hypothetical protein